MVDWSDAGLVKAQCVQIVEVYQDSGVRLLFESPYGWSVYQKLEDDPSFYRPPGGYENTTGGVASLDTWGELSTHAAPVSLTGD